MKVLSRVDKNCAYTEKVMENGEVRYRFMSGGGLSFSKTIASDWVITDDMPWQNPHRHGSLCQVNGSVEVYTQVSGWLFYVFEEGLEMHFGFLDCQGETITFQPGVEHIVLLGPKAVISTQRFSSELYQKNDWYPASEDFVSNFQKIKQGLELQIRQRQ